MADDIDKVKSDFEEKISGYDEAGKNAAKTAWNAALNGIRAVLVAKLGTIASLKVADGIINSKLASKATVVSAQNKSLNSDVVNPASKTLASYSSDRISSLKKSMSDTSAGGSNYQATVENVSRRNSYNQAKKDAEEKKLQQDVSTIDQLKF